MTIERKVGMGIAGQPSGGATDVAEVFSTDLYTGNSANRDIVNGIDLAGEGGMVWIKTRNQGGSGWDHVLMDTERGVRNGLNSNLTYANTVYAADTVTSFNSDGFSLGADAGAALFNHASFGDYASWTFRKKEKFFDVVTYTGNGADNRAIPHNLNSRAGVVLVKRLDASSGWFTYHKQLDGGVNNIPNVFLNTTAAKTFSGMAFQNYAGVGGGVDATKNFIVRTPANVNNATYVAYLFADNSTEDAEEQMIKCGNYGGTAADQSINLGWEPQFLLIRNVESAADWYILDTMRGFTATTLSNELVSPNNSNAASKVGNVVYDQYLTSTGFRMLANASEFNVDNGNYIYMAIRAPMMVEPEAATDVFAVAAQTGASGSTPRWVSGFVTDMTIQIEAASSNHTVGTRMLGGNVIYTDATNAASGGGGKYTWDYMTGFGSHAGANAANKELMWKRAKGYMDVVTWKGTGSARTIPHSLGVVPEMIWTKNRTTGGTDWAVYHKDLNGGSSPQNYYVSLNNVTAEGADNDLWNNTAPSSTVFTVRANEKVNSNNANFIGYLFATLAGISKVGSYTGNGSNQTINCGFSSGARFILIKRTNASGDWYVWDSVRGIVAGNDPHLSLNTSAAQVTSDDSIDPANAGFIVNQVSATNINVSSGTYIFYAIA